MNSISAVTVIDKDDEAPPPKAAITADPNKVPLTKKGSDIGKEKYQK